jgi:hypothetical protein
MIEARFDPSIGKWIPDRDLNAVGLAIPWIRERYRSNSEYAQAGVEAILGEHLQDAHILEANWLAATLFLNRGDHFEAVPLPPPAQFAPSFGVSVADFDGDGKEDVFLGQNFFGVRPGTSRNDSGRGVLLRGDGRGGFTEIPGTKSGIKVYGEQRGSAVADYDGDGRIDLAIGQNNAETKLYHNAGAKPGLRIHLHGIGENVNGIGAIIRLETSSGLGPAREVHSGSGYWSQDSSIQVTGTPEPPLGIQVRWPGGKVTTTPMPKGAREIRISEENGKIEVIQ